MHARESIPVFLKFSYAFLSVGCFALALVVLPRTAGAPDPVLAAAHTRTLAAMARPAAAPGSIGSGSGVTTLAVVEPAYRYHFDRLPADVQLFLLRTAVALAAAGLYLVADSSRRLHASAYRLRRRLGQGLEAIEPAIPEVSESL